MHEYRAHIQSNCAPSKNRTKVHSAHINASAAAVLELSRYSVLALEHHVLYSVHCTVHDEHFVSEPKSNVLASQNVGMPKRKNTK